MKHIKMEVALSLRKILRRFDNKDKDLLEQQSSAFLAMDVLASLSKRIMGRITCEPRGLGNFT